jgi:hypothetical protein
MSGRRWISSFDDLGTEITDTPEEDWQESLGEFSEEAEQRLRE